MPPARPLVVLAAPLLVLGCAGDRSHPNDADIADALPDGADGDAPPLPDADGDGDADAEAWPDADEEVSCPEGYQDNDGDGVCSPTCETAGVVCRGPAHCDDSSGALVCVCDEGYQDNDGDGSCRPTCETAELDCGLGGRCSDLSGTAQCLCDPGFQDNDGDGVCRVACGASTRLCGEHGACDDSSGSVACLCDEGYVGTFCERCRAGFQDNDGDRTCLPDCRTALLACEGASHCEDSSGEPLCVCDPGYEGPGCDLCEAGFQDNDGDGTCLPGCGTAILVCLGPGSCDDSGGTAVCACDPGYQDNDRNGTCRPDCATAAPACDAHEVCDDSGGEAGCVCVEGYQDNDGDGACAPDCAAAALTCADRRHCDDSSGTATCVCDRGYEGSDCEACAPGFDPAPGGCEPDHEWGFLVYMNGDNSLERYGWDDLDEMAAAGSSDEVHVVVLFDRFVGGATAYEVEAGAAVAVEDWGEPDMGDWRTLRDFGAWAVETYPARRYALVIWDHGDGWKGRPASRGFKGVSGDEHGTIEGISVSNGDLGRALGGVVAALEGESIDLLGFDACLMGMWEVAVAASPYADVLVASSELEPLEGWPYLGLLRGLLLDPGLSAHGLSRDIVDDYHAASPFHFTLAATSLGTLGRAEAALDGLAAALLAHPEIYPDLEAARAAAQGFDDPTFRDLVDLADGIAAIPGASAEVVDAASLLRAELTLTILASRAQPSHPGSHGLSVYIPPRGEPVDPAYGAPEAPWSAGTRWDELVSDFAASL